jgi:hypothetical protein
LELVILGPIDKLDIRIPTGTKLARQLEYALPSLNGIALGRSLSGTKYYHHVENLEQYGMSSILYFGHRRSGNHKLEITCAGELALSEIGSEIAAVFDIEPMQTEIMRIDAAVDVWGYPVDWFRHNAGLTRKRHSSEYGRFVAERRQVETLYFGRRPNIFRIYNKTEERWNKYRRLITKQNTGDPIPTFEELYGHRRDEILTRVERQYGAGRVPKLIGTLRGLKENAANINPFEPLRFLPLTVSEESVNELTGDAFIKGQGVLRLIERLGYHEAKRVMNKKTCRNANRLFTQLKNSDRTCTPPDLYAIYRDAINRQLSA